MEELYSIGHFASVIKISKKEPLTINVKQSYREAISFPEQIIGLQPIVNSDCHDDFEVSNERIIKPGVVIITYFASTVFIERLNTSDDESTASQLAGFYVVFSNHIHAVGINRFKEGMDYVVGVRNIVYSD